MFCSATITGGSTSLHLALQLIFGFRWIWVWQIFGLLYDQNNSTQRSLDSILSTIAA